MPVSMTSTAFLPTTMPTLGTSEAEPSGMAQTCPVSFSVTPSRTSEAGAGSLGVPDCWARPGSVVAVIRRAKTALRMSSFLGGVFWRSNQFVGRQRVGYQSELAHHREIVAHHLVPHNLAVPEAPPMRAQDFETFS